MELTNRQFRDRQAEGWARNMVQRFGWSDAVSMAHKHREQNAQGTYSFAHWNRICKTLDAFRTVG